MFKPGRYNSEPPSSLARDAAIGMRGKIVTFLESIAESNDEEHHPYRRYWVQGHEISDMFRMLARNVRKIEP